MEAIFNKLTGFLTSIIAVLLSFLPDSPFKFESAGEFSVYLGYLNYFIPVREMLTILYAWLAAITVYFISSAILRWVKAIE